MEWCWRREGWRGRDEAGGELGGEQQEQPGGGDGLEVAGGPFLEALQQPLKIEQQLATLVQWVSRKRGEKKKVKKNLHIPSHNHRSQNYLSQSTESKSNFLSSFYGCFEEKRVGGRGILLITPNAYFSLASGLARI